MKSFFRFFLVCGALVAVTMSFVATAPAGVTVVYAFVPKEQLSEAVKGKTEALAIEAAWRKEAMARPGYPIILSNVKYSIVLFIEMPAGFALWGKIGIPVQNPKRPVVLNVSQAPGHSGTYVADGGGLILTNGIPPEPKPYEWLEVNTK